MKMIHTIIYKSGDSETRIFKTKKDSDRAKKNAICLNKTFGAIQQINIDAVNNIRHSETITF